MSTPRQLVVTDVLPDTDEYRQKIAELQDEFRASGKELATSPTPSKASAVAKPSVASTVAPTPATAKAKPTPKPTPILKLPTPKEPGKPAVAVKKAPEPSKPQAAKQSASSIPNVVGHSLREATGLCSRAGIKLKVIGSGLAKSQKQVGDTLIVEFR